MNAATMTTERARLDTLRTGDQFRILGTSAWGFVRSATREVVFVYGAALGDRDIALDEWGDTEVEVRRADHTGKVRIDILTWCVDEGFVWHSTCYLPPTAGREDMIRANAPFPFFGHLAEMLEPDGPTRYRIGTHVLLERVV